MTLSERLTMFDSDKIDPFTLCGDRVTEDDLLAAEECLDNAILRQWVEEEFAEFDQGGEI